MFARLIIEEHTELFGSLFARSMIDCSSSKFGFILTMQDFCERCEDLFRALYFWA